MKPKKSLDLNINNNSNILSRKKGILFSKNGSMLVKSQDKRKETYG
jgi:hypothetical protein